MTCNINTCCNLTRTLIKHAEVPLLTSLTTFRFPSNPALQPENWNNFVEGIVKEITVKKRWLDFDLIAKIYIKEEWWNRLLELIKQNPALNYIEQYEKYLSKDYSDELVQLYAEAVIKQMKNSTGRNHYQTACRYLRRMIKLGGRGKTETIIANFRKEYPQRRALMEELNRV